MKDLLHDQFFTLSSSFNLYRAMKFKTKNLNIKKIISKIKIIINFKTKFGNPKPYIRMRDKNMRENVQEREIDLKRKKKKRKLS